MIEEFKIKYRELEARKRAELESAFERGEVADPFSSTIIVSILISAALSAASFVLSAALAPKPPRQTIGKLQGTLQLQNSEQGIMIPEIYGAGPAASIVAGASPTYQNKTNCTDGANGSITKTSGAADNYNAGASHNTTVVSGQDAFIRVIRGTGHAAAGFFNTASPTGSGGDATGMIFGVAWHPAGPMYPVINGVGMEVGNTASGDEFTIEVRSGRFHLYKGAAEILTFPAALPAQPASMWFGVIMYTTGAGVSNAKVKILDIGDPPNYAKGGIKVPAIIDWSSGIRKHVNVTERQVGGKGFMGGRSQTVENITYDIDLGLTYGRGALTLLREYANADVLIDQTPTSLLLSGVYDPGTGADADYDPALPPDPKSNYLLSLNRQDASISIDGDGVGTGTVQGGGSSFAIYPGNETQDPDPTEEADVDGKYGSGSTPAHRGKARVVHSNFDLSRWGGIVPNMTAAWEHQTLKTLDAIFASLCERVNVKTANGDYDFTGLATIKPRGMVIAGRLFSPAEVIGSPEIQTVYNYFVTEAEGQIKGYIEGTEPTVTIADTEIGWMDSDGEVGDILPEVDTILASEIGLARQVDVKFINLDKDWEPDTQSDNRQITDGVTTEVMEVQLALLASEARTAAQRKLYRDYVAGSVHKFTLPWTYLYLYPGYKITITRAEGFNHVLKLTSIAGGLGVLECEGVAIEPAAFTQPAVPSWGPGIQPIQSIPAMTILTFLDTPFLRDSDEKRDNIGWYVTGTPRTGVGQSWLGFALYHNRNNNWNLVPGASSNLPGTIGTIVSATGLGSDTSVFDRTGVIVVDLYGTDASLSSVTEADVLANPQLNQAVCGEMVIQFVTATQVSGFPNRWSLSVLLNGRRGTESHVTDTFTGMRFVLINAAVIFVPALVTDLNNLMEYRGVTSGQSLTDAATVDFAWTGGTAKTLPPSSLRSEADSDDNLLILFNRRTRIGGWMIPGSEVPLAEETEKYIVEIPDATPPRSWPVITGMGLAALLESSGANKFTDITVNNLTISGVGNTRARSIQEITETGNYAEATLTVGGTGVAGFGFITSNGDWTGGADAKAQSAYYVELEQTVTPSYVLRFYVNGVQVYSESASAYIATGIRVRITLSGSEVRFTKSWVGDGTPAQYVSAVQPSFPLKLLAQVSTVVGGGHEVEKVVMTIAPQPATIYTAAQIAEDGLVVGGPIRVRIAQVSAIVGVGGWAEATFSPFSASTIAGMKLWLKADSLSLNDGDAVATWLDQSGNANDASQSTAGNKPLYKIVSGDSFVRFDGTDDHMTVVDSPSIGLTGDISIFIVAKITDFAAYRALVSKTNGNQANSYEFRAEQTSGLPVLYRGNGAGSTPHTASAAPTVGVTTLIEVTQSGTSVAHYLNGVANGSGTLSVAQANINHALYIGMREDTGTKMKGDIAEIIIYDSALSAGNRAIVEGYLMLKYGL